MSKNRRDNPPAQNSAITTVTQSVSFSGPLPPPGLLAKYNEVIPNGADRIMAMAEKQGIHRETLESQIVAGNIASQARGSHYAFIICLVTIVGGFLLIGMGKAFLVLQPSLAASALWRAYSLSQRESKEKNASRNLPLLPRAVRSRVKSRQRRLRTTPANRTVELHFAAT